MNAAHLVTKGMGKYQKIDIIKVCLILYSFFLEMFRTKVQSFWVQTCQWLDHVSKGLSQGLSTYTVHQQDTSPRPTSWRSWCRGDRRGGRSAGCSSSSGWRRPGLVQRTGRDTHCEFVWMRELNQQKSCLYVCLFWTMFTVSLSSITLEKKNHQQTLAIWRKTEQIF